MEAFNQVCNVPVAPTDEAVLSVADLKSAPKLEEMLDQIGLSDVPGVAPSSSDNQSTP